jgi:hypothetical protein
LKIQHLRGKEKKTTHEMKFKTTLKNCAKPNWKIQTLRKRKRPNSKKLKNANPNLEVNT